MFWTSSVLIRPGFIRAFHMFVGNAVVIGSELVLLGTGSVNRYGMYSEESWKRCQLKIFCGAGNDKCSHVLAMCSATAPGSSGLHLRLEPEQDLGQLAGQSSRRRTVIAGFLHHWEPLQCLAVLGISPQPRSADVCLGEEEQ